jgi:hypothetical protein
VVSFTLAMNLLRGWPLVSLAASFLVAGALFVLWIRAGRPRGIALAMQEAEEEPASAGATEAPTQTEQASEARSVASDEARAEHA